MISADAQGFGSACHLPVSSWRDEVEQNVHTIISEARVTLDTRLLGENVIVLSLQVSDDLREAATF
jgi:hypothetical protein